MKKAPVIDFLALFRGNGIVFSWLHLEGVKKTKSIKLILSENVLALCINNYELINK